jgi:hypothetical protein
MMDENIALFERELGYIKCPDITKFVEHCLRLAPLYFWEKPSSSTGKYHPPQSNGAGGLVRHTQAATYFATAFCRTFSIEGRAADQVVAATILHDLCKYGLGGGKHTTKTHDKESADYVLACGKSYLAYIDVDCGTFCMADLLEICKAIAFHMGPWCVHDRKKPFSAFTPAEMVVHISDMASAQKEVGILFLNEPTVGVG